MTAWRKGRNINRFLGEVLKKEMADIFHFEDDLEDLDNL
jgi:hypothetical protein